MGRTPWSPPSVPGAVAILHLGAALWVSRSRKLTILQALSRRAPRLTSVHGRNMGILEAYQFTDDHRVLVLCMYSVCMLGSFSLRSITVSSNSFHESSLLTIKYFECGWISKLGFSWLNPRLCSGSGHSGFSPTYQDRLGMQHHCISHALPPSPPPTGLIFCLNSVESACDQPLVALARPLHHF